MIFTEIPISPFFIATLTLLWTVAILLDFRWRIGSLRLARLLIWTLAVLTLAALYLKPFHVQDQKSEDLAIIGQKALITTSDSLLHKGFRLLSPQNYSNTVFTTAVQHLALVGFELEPWELEQIRSDTISYEQSDLPGGIIAYAASGSFLGDSLSLTLSISHLENHMLYLTSLNEVLDSIRVEGNDVKVQLNTLPRAPGRYLYRVIGKSGTDTLYQEKIPVIINAPKKHSFLILNSYPSFESRFLKNYLAEEGYSIAVRTTVSTSISNTEFINHGQVFLEELTEQTLENFDVVVLDAGAFQNRKPAERKTLYDFVKEGKIGMLLINTSPAEAGEILDVETSSVSRTKWNGISIHSISGNALQPITYQDQTIGYFKNMGIGKVGFTTLQNLYKLKLSGEQELYRELLQNLLKPLLPMEKKPGFVMLEEPAVVDQPMEIGFTSFADVPRVYINGLLMPVTESPFRQGLYTTTYWPSADGWNTLLVLPDSLERDFYVHQESSWTTLRKHRLATYNALAAQTFKRKDQPEFREKAFISRWLLFAVLVTCFGLLWAEQKFINP